jgi:S1-C subfamily serine protease
MNGKSKIVIKSQNRLKVILLFILIIFTAGFIVGGSIIYGITASEIYELKDQIDLIQFENEKLGLQNIIYYYNETSFSDIYQSVKESIVTITGLTTYQTFFGTEYAEVQGSGFIYEYHEKMVVITNNHVVTGVSDIIVTFVNGNGYPAEIMGSDAYSDLAVLSVAAPVDEFHPLEIVSSSSLKVGDPVIAIGNPMGLDGTMTTGIVSQIDRTIKESLAGNFPIANIIQTSVAINPGNSGGPLLNHQGKVVGITTAIIRDSEGLGFAIPSNTILKEIGSLIEIGSFNEHPWLGISGVDMTYSIAQTIGVNVTYGWLICQVTQEGAADKAGLKGGDQQVRINEDWVIIGGDIIIAIDGTRIINGDTLMSYLEEYTSPNQTILVTIIRENQLFDVSVELETRPMVN